MTEARDLSARVRFGVFDLDLRTGELRKRGAKVRLQDQPFQVLAILLEKRGELVTREDLRQRLWTADTFVDFDHGLNKAINKLRDALGDSAVSPRFIETVARRGYRFIGDVTAADNAVRPDARMHATGESLAPDDFERLQVPERVPEQVGIGAHRSWPYAWMIAAVAFAALATTLVVWLNRKTDSSAPIRSLAVLPLDNLTGDAAEEYFADGMTDQLIANLGQILTKQGGSNRGGKETPDAVVRH